MNFKRGGDPEKNCGRKPHVIAILKTHLFLCKPDISKNFEK